MIIKWQTIKDLPEESLSELWNFLKDIKNIFETEKPAASVSIPLFSRRCNNPIEKEWVRTFREKLLNQLEKKEGVLKVLKGTTKKEVDFANIRIDEDKFNSFYKDVEKEVEKLGLTEKTQKDAKSSSLIARDANGDFYCRGKLINFQNNEAIYYKVFIALFEKSDVNGFCSYQEIDKFLTKNGEDKLKSTGQVVKRITNAATNLFRFTKNLPNKAPNGKPIIKVKRGEGLIFYNPPS